MQDPDQGWTGACDGADTGVSSGDDAPVSNKLRAPIQAIPDNLREGVVAEKLGTITGVAEASLMTQRVRGGGPVFFKVGQKVIYTRRTCFEHLAARRRTSTSDTGRAA